VQATVNRKVATLAVPEAIAYTRSIYRNELDKMMQTFRTSAPDFYKVYFAARVIVESNRLAQIQDDGDANAISGAAAGVITARRQS
jgi:hypothetical protein